MALCIYSYFRDPIKKAIFNKLQWNPVSDYSYSRNMSFKSTGPCMVCLLGRDKFAESCKHLKLVDNLTICILHYSRTHNPNRRQFLISWHIDPLLGADREICDCTAAVVKQRSANNNTGMVFSARSAKHGLNRNWRKTLYVPSVHIYYKQDS
jgi:hypothetical protein